MHPSIQKAREVLARTSEHYESERRARERQRRDDAAVIEPPSELIYKTYETPAPQPRDASHDDDWNAWADSRIANFFAEQPFTETQSEVIAEVIAELRREFHEHVEKKFGKSSSVELVRKDRNVA